MTTATPVRQHETSTGPYNPYPPKREPTYGELSHENERLRAKTRAQRENLRRLNAAYLRILHERDTAQKRALLFKGIAEIRR